MCTQTPVLQAGLLFPPPPPCPPAEKWRLGETMLPLSTVPPQHPKNQCVGSLSRLNPTLSHLSLTLTCRLERGAHTTQEVLSRTWVHPQRSHIGLPFALNILKICLSSDADVHFACP